MVNKERKTMSGVPKRRITLAMIEDLCKSLSKNPDDFVVERVGRRIEITNNVVGHTGVYSTIPEAYFSLLNGEV